MTSSSTGFNRLIHIGAVECDRLIEYSTLIQPVTVGCGLITHSGARLDRDPGRYYVNTVT